MLARYRALVTPLALIAALILVYMENPWFYPKAGTTENHVATVAFWVLTIVVLVLMFEDRKSPGAEKVPAQGSAPITFDWYRSFLQFLIDNHAQGWFAVLIVIGELAVGVALLVGALVGIAAFFGVVMNMSYLLAGSTSVNPIMFALAIGLILGWKVAGHYGVDRYLLPRLGVPWRAKVAATSQS